MTRKQHWIPQFYLRCFADSSGQLHAYRAKDDIFFRSATENICGKRDLYEVEHTDAAKGNVGKFYAPNFIEEGLSRFEGHIAPHYEQFLDCCRHKQFDEKEFLDGKFYVCMLAANLIVRHPATIHIDRDKTDSFVRWYRAQNELTKNDFAILEKTEWNEDYPALIGLAIEATLLFSDDEEVPFYKICSAFSIKNFSVFEAPVGMSFVTTSMPMFIVGPEDDSYDFDIAYIPLSDQYAAIFSTAERFSPFVKLNYSHITFLNHLMLLNSSHWDTAMCKIKGSLELAVKDWKKSTLCHNDIGTCS